MKQSAYKAAGVDIDAGEALVSQIKPLATSTNRAGVMGGLGGFGALFDVKAAGYKDPVLVSSTDGVGTKLKIAIETGRHNTVGIDLVAMCVNDLLVQGAEPLFFLDYFASGHLNVGVGTQVISGIAEGCREARCALIGGETAEMPGMYQDGDYDLAGFTVGAVERERILTGAEIQDGDVVLGIASSGLHSNGYSLVRKIVADSGLTYESPAPFSSSQTLADILLIPTKLYIRSVLPILKETSLIKGLAHITGGGLIENIPRVLPKGLGVVLDARAWTRPDIFGWLQESGGLDSFEMARTLNCGIGMVAICRAEDTPALLSRLTEAGETVWPIGSVTPCVADKDRVGITHTESAWAKN
ncbi:MAG: phosphoribosylformylglycinamidine cyclo-ligase [Alphaproteobacteria bacterium]|jgi:phosphoribosylformylglycinamidine cyclo-ligase|nr:phosphoribosylformylglycinamidine cyclo-ligase [Alphaproteobacteria bacterium]MBP9867810.1 phosphoribosylformylglycinamidine cyclo-ligase [Alphaproteobacteria bacterium]